jgi:hypothetical protein
VANDITATATQAARTILVNTHFTDNIVRVGLNYQFHSSDYGFCKSLGSLAMFAAMRRASSC